MLYLQKEIVTTAKLILNNIIRIFGEWLATLIKTSQILKDALSAFFIGLFKDSDKELLDNILLQLV